MPKNCEAVRRPARGQPRCGKRRHDKFWVATPTYYLERQVDPRIVGEIGGGAGRWVVIARWD